jgi:multidrug efflux system membrane fusion protein
MKWIRMGLPALILISGVIWVAYLRSSRPEAQRRAVPVTPVKVEFVTLQPEEVPVLLQSQGTVEARTQSTLIPEVTGRIIEVSESFREGGFFKAGEVLLKIDPSDYETALTIARADRAEAEFRLAEEAALSRQALEDWERLRAGEAPDSLVLREPQLQLAKANCDAANARVQEAERALERTEIRAPFAGRVLRQQVDLGQVVGPGTVLAEIYAVDRAEVRLPLTSNEYGMLDLPRESGAVVLNELSIPVRLETHLGDRTVAWEGQIVRVEGAVDTRTRQFYVVAQVLDPYGSRHPEPLKVGLFVTAYIEGRRLKDVYTLPRTALRESRFVLTLDDENRIFRVPVKPLWSTAEKVVFREPSIAPGTRASITQMAIAVDGMHVLPVDDLNAEAPTAKASAPESPETTKG